MAILWFINIVIIIKKGNEGNFALEPLENCNSIFLRIEFAYFIDFKRV